MGYERCKVSMNDKRFHRYLTFIIHKKKDLTVISEVLMCRDCKIL
jgi:hypothetical protein